MLRRLCFAPCITLNTCRVDENYKLPPSPPPRPLLPGSVCCRCFWPPNIAFISQHNCNARNREWTDATTITTPARTACGTRRSTLALTRPPQNPPPWRKWELRRPSRSRRCRRSQGRWVIPPLQGTFGACNTYNRDARCVRFYSVHEARLRHTSARSW